MEVFSHSPFPRTGGTKVSGSGSSPCRLRAVRGTTGRSKTTVTVVSGSSSSLSGAGMTWLTVTKPTVWNSKAMLSASGVPSIFRAPVSTVSR